MVGGRPGRWLAAAALVALWTATAAAQGVSIDARVDRNHIQEGESVNLTIDVRYSGRLRASVTRPMGDDFRVVGSSSFQSFVGGFGSSGGQTQLTQNYTLVPTHTGTMTIGSVSANIGGSSYRTDPITITVSPSGAGPPVGPPVPGPGPGYMPAAPPAAPPAFTQPSPAPGPVTVPVVPQAGGPPLPAPGLPTLPDRVDPTTPFLVVNPARRQVFVGEQFVVDYELFQPLLYGWDLTGLRQPSFSGFWFEAVPVDTVLDYTQHETTVAGVPFRSQLVARFVVVPLESGTQSLPQMHAEVAAVMGQQVEIASQPGQIDVLPLPPGAPVGFSSNNVGDYNFTVQIDPGGGRVGDAIRVTMRVDGMGLVSLVDLPTVTVPHASIQPPVERREQTLENGAIRGYKQVETVIVPTREGSITLGPFVFNYFEPRTARYQTVQHDAMTLNISGFGPNADLVAQHVEQDQVSLLDALGAARGSAPRASWSGLPQLVFLVLAGLPPVAFVLVTAFGRWWRRRQRSRPERVKRGALGHARRQVRQARGRSGPEAYGLVAGALREYLRDRFEVKAAALTSEGTAHALAQRGLPGDLADEVGQVLEACEMGRFGSEAAGAENGNLADVVQRAEEALSSLEGHA